MDYSAELALDETSSELIRNFVKNLGPGQADSGSMFPDIDDVSEAATYSGTPVSTDATTHGIPSVSSYSDANIAGSEQLDPNEFSRRLKIYDDILNDEPPPAPSTSSIARENEWTRPFISSHLRDHGESRGDADAREQLEAVNLPSLKNRLNLTVTGAPSRRQFAPKSKLPRFVPINSSSGLNGGDTDRFGNRLNVSDSSRKEQTEGLSLDDWDYLRDICTFLDNHVDEEITPESSLNLEDVRKASTALGLQQPEGVVLETLLEIGLLIYKFADTDAPWTYALQDFELKANAKHHAEYLEQRRQDQDRLAASMSRQKTLRNFLKLWQLSVQNDVKSTYELLRALDTEWLLPDYFLIWRKRAGLVRRLEASADKASERTIYANSLRALRQNFSLKKELAGESEALSRNIAKRRILFMMKTKAGQSHDLQNLADTNSEELVERRYLSLWSLKRRERVASRLVQEIITKGTLALLVANHNTISSCQAEAVRLKKKHLLHDWRAKLAFTAVTNENGHREAAKLANCGLLRGYFASWRHEALVFAQKDAIKNQLMRRVFAKLRSEAVLSRLCKHRGRIVARSHINTWHDCLKQNQLRENDTQMMRLMESQSVKRTIYNLLWRAYLESRQRDVLQKSMRNTLLKQSALRELKNRMSEQFSKENGAAILHESLVKRKTLKILSQESEKARHERLTAAHAEATQRLDSQTKLRVLVSWRATTRSHRGTYDALRSIRSRSIAASLLDSWRALLDEVVDMENAAEAELLARMQSIPFRIWRQSLKDVQELEEVSDDLNIGWFAQKFRVGLRKWHRDSLAHNARSMQAVRYREQRLRSAELVMLQRWRDQVPPPESSEQYETAQGDYSTDISYHEAQQASKLDSSRLASVQRVRTPRKLLHMSPRALQKWKPSETEPRNTLSIFASSPPFESREQTLSRGSPQNQVFLRSRAAAAVTTPTKPRREHGPYGH